MATLREWLEASYPAALVRRFFALELLDRSFGLAAQAFVAMLPLVIVIVSAIFTDGPETIANSIGDRFGLDDSARGAIRLLFTDGGAAATVSWLAVVITVLSAFSLSRRLARVYASIFGVPPLARSQTWRGIVWVGLQLVLFISASVLRDVRRDNGMVIAILAVIALLVLWFAADVAGLRLLVPSVGLGLVIASAVTSSVARFGIAIWAAFYMPTSLSDQAAQFGPIGVTFALFTYILAGVLAYVCSPLVVTTWVKWRAERVAATT